MAPGFVYTRWETRPGSAGAFGENLVVWFGKRGRKVEWVVENTRDPHAVSYYDCTKHEHFAPQAKVFRFGKRVVYYAGGARGQDATLCLPNHQAVWVWNDYSLSAQALARIAASARPVG
jgi:hypothetical protein